jgi:RNA polymerase sigma-70 factor (ECF subfamily)
MTTPLGVALRRRTRAGGSHEAPREAIANVETNTVDDGLSAFLSARPRLFGIAYRMLGSAAEAEDIVQDVWVRWQTAERGAVRNASAFLARATTRLAINAIQSARSRHETCVGPWLPEPVDTSAEPRVGAERGEALKCAVLVLLEKLSPTARAAYVLREAFDYAYREIADILRLEEANARQLVTRARQRVIDEHRAPVTPVEQQRLLNAFISVARGGDVAALVSSARTSSPPRTVEGSWNRCGSRSSVVSVLPDSSGASLASSGAA